MGLEQELVGSIRANVSADKDGQKQYRSLSLLTCDSMFGAGPQVRRNQLNYSFLQYASGNVTAYN